MAKPIKILFTIPNFDSAGSGKVVYDLVKNLDRSKFEPHICCNHGKGVFFNKVKALNVPIHIFNITGAYKPVWSLFFRVWNIRNFLKKHKFNLVHSWHWSSDFTEPLACKFAGIPFVYTKKAMGWGNRSWQWRSKLSSKIIAINSDMKRQFFANLSHKVVSIPIGLNTKSFGILPKSYRNKDGIIINENEFVIASIANLVAVKGIEYLLEAVNQIQDKRIKVLIVGDDSSDYAKKLKSAYQSDAVIFTGKKHNIEDYLALADVFVIPTKSIGEGQPIAPIEAMLSGRIVLGAAVPGIKDVLQPFPELLFAPENPEAIAEKINTIMQMSEEDREQLASELYNQAFKNFNLEKSIEAHQKLYLSLVT